MPTRGWKRWPRRRGKACWADHCPGIRGTHPPTLRTMTSGVRDEVRTWLEETWDPERPLLEWRGLLADSGWACPTWPTEYYGRGLSPAEAGVVAKEFAAVGAVGAATGSGMALAAPTILEHAPDELKRRLLRRIITGEDKWCQLFSEPGNGSDLAGLTTRADRDGD